MSRLQQSNKFSGGGGINWKLLIDNVEFTTLENEMADVKKSVADGKTMVASAISNKGIATTGADTFAKMAENVEKIITLGQGTADGNAIASQILSGLVAYVKGNRLVGTMPNRGAVTQSLGINGTYTIAEGYHNGAGKITQSIATKSAQTYTPGTANQTINAGQYLSGAQTIAGSGNLVPGNIKQGVNIFGVVGDLRVSLPIAFSTTTIQINRSVSIYCRETDSVQQTIMSETELNGGDHCGYTLTFKAECQFGLPNGTAMATTSYTNTVMVSASGITKTQGQAYVSFNANTIYCVITAGSENGNIYAKLAANSQGMTAKITLVSAQVKRI